MKVTLNDQPLELERSISISDLLAQLDRQQPGSALAINQTIIPRNQWTTHYLQDGDDILLFQAIAGG